MRFSSSKNRPEYVANTRDLNLRVEVVNLRTVVDAVVAHAEQHIESQNIKPTIDVPFGIDVIADQKALAAAVDHLVRNALNFMPNGGELVITGIVGDRTIELEVADSHAYSPKATNDQVNAPLGSSPEVCERLTQAEQIVRDHGGLLSTMNCPEGGVAFTIHLPTPQVARAAA